MATIKRVFIFLTSISSGLAAIFTLVALVTQSWVYTDNALWIDQQLTSPNGVEYGLFQGYYRQKEPRTTTVQLEITCLFKENICAYLCAKESDTRYDILKSLYNNDQNVSQPISECSSVQRTVYYPFRSTLARAENNDKKFINAGVWLSTIFFLTISIVFGLISSALSIWNTVSNPVEAYFSIFGLYIYNAVALGCVLIGIILWGVMYITTIFHDVGIFFTLNGDMSTDKSTSLGYSYWLLIVPLVFYIGSIALLFIRQYLLSKEPGHKMVQREDTADPGIYLY